MNASNTVFAWRNCLCDGFPKFQAFLLTLVLAATLNASAMEYYVATDGDDTHDGTSLATPFATLQKAIGQAGAGDTVYVRGGTYRQQVTATTGGGAANAYLTIQAYGDEKPVFKGSDLVTGWEHHEGAIWKKTGWTINSQQVFCNEHYLQQIGPPNASNFEGVIVPVGTGVSDMYPGSFHYDSVEKILYVWLSNNSDPNSAVMDVSIRCSVLSLDISYVHVKGFIIRHCNPTMYDFNPSQYAAVRIGPDSIIERCDIQWGDFAGLLMKSRSEAFRCIISNNGDVGVGASKADNILVRECVINGNNYRNFNPMWHAGGLKLIPDVSGTIEENEIFNNNGSGVWFDWCKTGNLIVIRNNRIQNNLNRAIFIEGSENSLAYNNLISGNSDTGIYVSASNDTRIYNNTIICNENTDISHSYVAIYLGGVPHIERTLINNKIFNNIVFGGIHAYDLIIPQNNDADIIGNTSDFNCFFRMNDTIKLNSNNQTYSSLDTWRAATGFDLHSISADPRFNLRTPDDYSTSTTSPAVDAGMTLPEVTTDILGKPRPQGVASDMGAHETSGPDTEPPTAPPGVAATLVTWNSVRVTWNPASDNIGVDCYQVYRDGVRCADTTSTEFLDTGLAALTTYRYHVIAIDCAGLQSEMSDVIAILTGPLPETVPPSIPQKLSVITKTAWQVTLAWKAATDNVGVTEYWIYRNGRKVGTSGSTRFTDSGLLPVTRYEYRVSALDAAGNQSKLSKILAVRTLAAPVLTMIEQWRLDYFGTSSDSGNAADAFDFDQDGSVNFVEYALGRNPTSSLGDDGPLGMPDPEPDIAADRLVLVIDLPDPTPAEVLYEVLATGDLVNWTRIAQKAGTAAWVRMDSDGTIVLSPAVAGRQITRVQDSVSMTAHSRRMMTLRLSGLP